jgi:N-methylhydantoinase A
MGGKGPQSLIVGSDVGGTFTDTIISNAEGDIFITKVPSTAGEYSGGVVNGIQAILSQASLPRAYIERIIHGSTVATNTCVERTGARVGLITTTGFRDILDMGRGRRPEMYNLFWGKTPPLVPRYLRLEVDERIGSKGEILQPLNINGASAAIDWLISEGVESIAVCLYNSYANPIHEQKIGELIRAQAPKLYFCLSSEVMPLIKEYERTSETVVNAYLIPIMDKYLASLVERLVGIEVKAPVYVMQSNGGVGILKLARERPIDIIECGPAAGVVGAAHLGRALGMSNLISFDMGGTTCKSSIVEDGEYTRSVEYEVGAGIHMASRLLKGKGYVLRVPSIDIAEIGAGGGSLVCLDEGGAIHIGPRSAGAVPGPVCYDMGGETVTLTDVDVVLGYLNPTYLVGGDLKLNKDKAYQAVEDQLAKPLGLETLEAAYGIYTVANSNMRRAITAVSSERGRDPRKFALVAFGGAGPVHAVGIAEGLGISKVIIPPYAGIFSAAGLLAADIEQYYVRAFRCPAIELRVDDLNQAFKVVVEQAISVASAEGYDEVMLERYADMRYPGQSSELTIPVPYAELNPTQMPQLVESFNQEHEKTFGHCVRGNPVEVVNIRVVCRVPLPKTRLRQGNIVMQKGMVTSISEASRMRKAYFGKTYGLIGTPVLKRDKLNKRGVEGPVIIEEYDSTTVVPPGCRVSMGEQDCMIIEIKARETENGDRKER